MVWLLRCGSILRSHLQKQVVECFKYLTTIIAAWIRLLHSGLSIVKVCPVALTHKLITQNAGLYKLVGYVSLKSSGNHLCGGPEIRLIVTVKVN